MPVTPALQVTSETCPLPLDYSISYIDVKMSTTGDRITAVLRDTQWRSYIHTPHSTRRQQQPTHRKHYYSLVTVQYPNAYQLEFNRLDCFRNLQLMLVMVQKFNQFGLVCTAYGISITSIHARKWYIIHANIF